MSTDRNLLGNRRRPVLPEALDLLQLAPLEVGERAAQYAFLLNVAGRIPGIRRMRTTRFIKTFKRTYNCPEPIIGVEL